MIPLDERLFWRQMMNYAYARMYNVSFGKDLTCGYMLHMLRAIDMTCRNDVESSAIQGQHIRNNKAFYT